MSLTYAHCYRSGEILLSEQSFVDGCLQIGSGTQSELERKLAARARLAYDGKTWLVPGLPEAECEDDALGAFREFRGRLERPLPMPSTEPIYIAQSFEAEHTASSDAAMQWWGQQLAEAREKNDAERLWPRFSWTPEGTEPRGILIEVWDQKPAEEGAPRWALQLAG